MKILGLVFSARNDGNSFRMLDYCMKKFKGNSYEIETINIHDLNINPCGNCNIECCKGLVCPIQDDIPRLLTKCFEADLLLFSLPTYCGHLPSTYFMLSERSQALISKEFDYEKEYLRKLNFIFIGNITSGADMSTHEALYTFAGLNFSPESVLFSSRDYDMKPINGDLIENGLVQQKLNAYVGRLLKKASDIIEVKNQAL
ncbi:flavodoxin family protein [Bacillus sp. 1NLA3E]|uniref:flavodoxin family protein n=1 Tax=Bacillus sp. 1NLA3E TaxID=666686 RepID=UPI000247E5FF|nr:NAD(P)H-dependent oxidoreductase [Bacillus sp. 1NLA3E]AGK54312.1 Multimeric flavodoxin (WrbA) domain containing protein [Bacillus sp. 1NLA3E]